MVLGILCGISSQPMSLICNLHGYMNNIFFAMLGLLIEKVKVQQF